MTNASDWKSTLGKFFADNGTYRVEYLKKKIEKDLKEYIEFMESFHKIRVERKNFEEIDGKVYTIQYIIHLGNTLDSRIEAFPFILGLNVNKECHVDLVTSKEFLAESNIKNILKTGSEGKDFYVYHTEELTEEERFEKEWLFQIINQRLMNYVESFRN